MTTYSRMAGPGEQLDGGLPYTPRTMLPGHGGTNMGGMGAALPVEVLPGGIELPDLDEPFPGGTVRPPWWENPPDSEGSIPRIQPPPMFLPTDHPYGRLIMSKLDKFYLIYNHNAEVIALLKEILKNTPLPSAAQLMALALLGAAVGVMREAHDRLHGYLAGAHRARAGVVELSEADVDVGLGLMKKKDAILAQVKRILGLR